MSHENTILELAEVIADQAARIRELEDTVDEQCQIIVDSELDQEDSEKIDAALYTDLVDVLENVDSVDGVADELSSVISKYFSDTEPPPGAE